MLTFFNAEDLKPRMDAIGAVIEGDLLPLKIKMPCRFAIVTPAGREFGNPGDYLVFQSANEPSIETEPTEPTEPTADIKLKRKK